MFRWVLLRVGDRPWHELPRPLGLVCLLAIRSRLRAEVGSALHRRPPARDLQRRGDAMDRDASMAAVIARHIRELGDHVRALRNPFAPWDHPENLT